MIDIPKAENVKVYECDFLVVGGGDAGCSAAIEAAENGKFAGVFPFKTGDSLFV